MRQFAFWGIFVINLIVAASFLGLMYWSVIGDGVEIYRNTWTGAAIFVAQLSMLFTVFVLGVIGRAIREGI